LLFVSYILANEGEMSWTASIIIRGGGLAAVATGVLLIIAVLLRLVFALGQVYFTGGVDILDALVSGFGVLMLLGLVGLLVGLYVHVSEEAGLLGLVGFLVAFFGTALGTQGDLWALLLADLGFALFGVASLRSGVYPRRASILLIIGAVLSGVAACVHEFIGVVGMLGVSVEVIGAIGDIIFSASLVWLGLSLFRRRAEEVQRPYISQASESI
jgi:hypothetical protein